MSVRVSLRGILRLIRVDTLRRIHNVGFLVERFICLLFILLYSVVFNRQNTLPLNMKSLRSDETGRYSWKILETYKLCFRESYISVSVPIEG